MEPTEDAASNASSQGHGSVVAQATTALSKDPMMEYVQLKQELYITIAVIGVVIFVAVWLAFGLNVALNYVLGTVVGLVYIRMLAQEVEKLGNNKRTLNSNRLVVFAGVMILAMLVPQLQVLPVFLGFITYKAALLVYTCRLLLLPSDRP